MMTADELTDLRSIAAAVHRIELVVERQAGQIDALQGFADKAQGALTLAKVVLSLLGFSGIAWLFATLAQRGTP